MFKEKFLKDFYNLFKENKGKTLGALIGFFFGVLILLIGFFKTLILIICTLIGYYLGSRWDLEGDLKKLLNRILPPQLR
ncbi:MAG: DUF2273 domain-containing protein [Halanaerobiales bacterium]